MNCSLVCLPQAFKVAQDKLKVPALLDAEDLVSMDVIDELSVMTYVSMLYKRMNKRSRSGSGESRSRVLILWAPWSAGVYSSLWDE